MKKYNSIAAVILSFVLFVVSALSVETSFADTGKMDPSVGVMRVSHAANAKGNKAGSISDGDQKNLKSSSSSEKPAKKSEEKLSKNQSKALFQEGVGYMYGTGKDGFNYKKAKEFVI